MLRRVGTLAQAHPVIGEVRGRGLMIGIELVETRDTMAPATDRAVKVRAACRERGLLIGIGGFSGNVLRIQPPLVISEAQLGEAADTLDDALRATA
jgi:4-aminobutyrate aminotransferase-like enzyme